VATHLTAHDALGAHARDELGLVEIHAARPIQAALASAGSFAVGAALPLAMVFVAPGATLVTTVVGASLVLLAILGGVAAKVGGAPLLRGTMRVLFWGALAMGITAAAGALFGAAA